MLVSQIGVVTDLIRALKKIDGTVGSAADVKILVNGDPIEDDLLKQLHAVGDPVVVQYFAGRRAAIVAKLNALGVTES